MIAPHSVYCKTPVATDLLHKFILASYSVDLGLGLPVYSNKLVRDVHNLVQLLQQLVA